MSCLEEAIEMNPSLLRTYSLHKFPNYIGYGLSIIMEDIQPTQVTHRLVFPFLEIEPGSPAHRAGMRNGQRLVAVNGLFVNKNLASVENIVRVIDDCFFSDRGCIDLAVLDLKVWLEWMENSEAGEHKKSDLTENFVSTTDSEETDQLKNESHSQIEVFVKENRPSK
jgi:hypothetical protein